jgi:hypothetical protein
MAGGRSKSRVADQSVEHLPAVGSLPTTWRDSAFRWTAWSPEQTAWGSTGLSQRTVSASSSNPFIHHPGGITRAFRSADEYQPDQPRASRAWREQPFPAITSRKKRENLGLLRHSQSGKKVQGAFCYLLLSMRRTFFPVWRRRSPRTCLQLIHRSVSPIADLPPCAVCCSLCSFCKRWGFNEPGICVATAVKPWHCSPVGIGPTVIATQSGF